MSAGPTPGVTTSGRPNRRPRPALVGGIVALVVVVVGSVLVLANRGGTVAPSPAPSGAVVAQAADRTPLVSDGKIDDGGLRHDSRADLYRVPFGAVPAGSNIVLRLRATAGDLTDATVRVYDARQKIQALVPMAIAATDRSDGDHGYDYWQATLRTSAQPTVLWYRFIVRDGPTTRYVEDDPPADSGAASEGADGGTGKVYAQSIDSSWQVDVYQPDFATPAWTHGALVYQIFPDRFFNADPANDPSPTAVQGTTGAAVFRYGDVYGNPILQKAWTDRPEGYCRAYAGGGCTEQPLGRDFFGGDLAGITAKLDDLKALGVTALYLNPIFAAPSNHRYDTSSYDVIDPDLGTQADFDALIAGAKARGIGVILDGVFNHVSSDSPWFDRSRRFTEVGACESATSPFRSWFTFRAPQGNEPSPCAPSTKGGTDTYYQGWFGFDTIPEVVEQGAVYDLFTGPNGVVRHWLRSGTAGWRLDVMDNLSAGFMHRIRAVVKSTSPDALILGEQWSDSSDWLLGDQADSTMNYRFRRAVIGLVNGQTNDLDGAIAGLTPSTFASRMDSLREDYPKPAFDALLNLVDSHDTTRILWTLTPGADDPAIKESAAALAVGKAKLRTVAALQLTWPGMASVYYGTEAGLTGQDDPDDRRPYPWDSIDTSLRDWYRSLGQLRAQHVALREGDLHFVLADDQAQTLAYVRRTDQEAALVVLNLSDQERQVAVDTTGFMPEGAGLVDGLTAAATTVGPTGVSVSVPAHGAAILLTKAGTDLMPPGATRGLAATARPGAVELTWTATSDAASYTILRSLVTGGGYVPVGTTATTAFADPTVRNGTDYHYVVTAIDAAGNAGPRSNEAEARPVLILADARLDAPPSVDQALTATGPGSEIGALVRVDGVTSAPGATVGLRAQLGFGDATTTDPATSDTWSDMVWSADVSGADRFVGSVLPDAAGSTTVILRVSTDGGASWAYADRGGIVARPGAAFVVRPDRTLTLVARPAVDTAAPPAPGLPRVATVGEASLVLEWDPVGAPDIFRYEILRAADPDGAFAVVGTSVEPTFTDDTIDASATYRYEVQAVDSSFNRSPASPPVTTAATVRPVSVTFTVHLPAGTPKGDTIYIAGAFQGWNPGTTPMKRLDARTWTISLPFTEGGGTEYKYTRGSWEKVEKDDACGEIPNRTLTATFGTDGQQAVSDTVGKWRDVDHCP